MSVLRVSIEFSPIGLVFSFFLKALGNTTLYSMNDILILIYQYCFLKMTLLVRIIHDLNPCGLLLRSVQRQELAGSATFYWHFLMCIFSDVCIFLQCKRLLTHVGSSLLLATCSAVSAA